MSCDNCTIPKSEFNELPEIAKNGSTTMGDFMAHHHESIKNGFTTVSDFLAHHHESIEVALRNSEFQYLIAFHPDPDSPMELWRKGAFRVYVSEEQLEAARDFCMLIEFISSPNRNC